MRTDSKSSAMQFLMLFYVLLHAKYVKSEPYYPPLPQGKAYTLDKDDGKWSLHGLSSIANGIALTLRSQPPYGKAVILNIASSSKRVCLYVNTV